MSSEQSSVNAETVEQTKQQIRGLVNEIAQLSKSNLAPEQYYEAFLQRIVSALAAVGGAVWILGDSRRPELTYQINLSDTLLDAESDEAVRHFRLLNHLVQSAEPRLVPPLSGPGDESAGANPTRFLLVLAPLVNDGRVEGLVEIFQRPDSQPATQRGYLRFLVQMCELAGEWLKSRKLRQFSDRHSLWAQADQFSRLVHQSLDVRETAYTIANEGRRLIGCDRVSVAILRGRACKIESVSGQDTIENRSNIVAALDKLATRVVATGEPLWYEGSTDDLPPQVEEAIEVYVDESYAKAVTVLPLRKPARIEEVTPDARTGDVASERNTEREVIGALIVEQIESDLARDMIEPRIDLVFEHSTRALSNAINHNSVFLMPVWRAIGKSAFLVKARTLPKTLIVSALILIVLVVLFAFRRDFNLESEGRLQPVVRRDVFFDGNGTVTAIKVKDGDRVTQGQLLVELVNHDLEQEWEKVTGDLNETQAALWRVIRNKNQPGLTDADRAEQAREQVQLELRRQQLVRQLVLIEKKREQLKVYSPIDGQVMLSWDAEQSLLHRPVMVGQVVMTVADPDGDWELELAMPERRMGHVNAAAARFAPDPLQANYILATDPANRRYGTVRRVDTATQVRDPQQGPTVKIMVDIDKTDIQDLASGAQPRPGATVTAEVHCGRATIAYTLFYEVIEWVQKHLLF